MPVWKVIKSVAQHPLLRGMTETQIQERVLHACLTKILEGSEEFCGTGHLSRDCNGQACWVVTRLMLWIADLKEKKALLSMPDQVPQPPAHPSWPPTGARPTLLPFPIRIAHLQLSSGRLAELAPCPLRSAPAAGGPRQATLFPTAGTATACAA